MPGALSAMTSHNFDSLDIDNAESFHDEVVSFVLFLIVHWFLSSILPFSSIQNGHPMDDEKAGK
jgi:hypothetical protein